MESIGVQALVWCVKLRNTNAAVDTVPMGVKAGRTVGLIFSVWLRPAFRTHRQQLC